MNFVYFVMFAIPFCILYVVMQEMLTEMQ